MRNLPPLRKRLSPSKWAKHLAKSGATLEPYRQAVRVYNATRTFSVTASQVGYATFHRIVNAAIANDRARYGATE